jgi:hypothetical protein
LRRFVPLLGVLLLACGQETALAPPRQVDRVSELTADVTGDFLKPNPAPEAWMLGCYALPRLADWSAWPARVELTNKPGKLQLMKQSYAVRHVDANVSPERWSWQPVTRDELRVSIGEAFTSWELTLQRTPKGLGGRGRLWTCLPREGTTKAVELVKVPCG